MSKLKLNTGQKETRRRIIELSYQSGFSHIGSGLSAVDIIDAIYRVKRKEERFVLSGGHAAIALYGVLEKKHIMDSTVIHELHIHPDRNVNIGIDVSTGSLGQGLPIALGMALAHSPSVIIQKTLLFLSAKAIPSAIGRPCPRLPVDTSMPILTFLSG